MKNFQIVQNVGSTITHVLPSGTHYSPIVAKNFYGSDPADEPMLNWKLAPNYPPDLFAACGHLCRVGGVVGFFDPSPYATEGKDCQFVFIRDERDKINDIADEWRDSIKNSSLVLPLVTEAVQSIWASLCDHWDDPVTPGPYLHDKTRPAPAPWWRIALKLVMISDMVCERIGKDPLPKKGSETTPFEVIIRGVYAASVKFGKVRSTRVSTRPAPKGPASLGVMADTAVACVLPKIRVAPVGATVRNASRNLALLPGRGEVRCAWDVTGAEVESEDNETLDILLIPVPFTLDATDFVATENPEKTNREKRQDKRDWENFHVTQSWIETESQKRALVANCRSLLKACARESRAVNGVIFPEYSLNYRLFDRLCNALKKQAPSLEFVIAGACDNCEEEEANTLLTRVWDKHDHPDFHATNSRKKHHRWRLNRQQVEAYALGTSLNPKIKNWWENTPVGQRELTFHRFRKNSVFAALICEELARSDPCHEILRSVAPNLVFALLMDGPQIRQRWPAQYASNLADDPGSSVLTFTSYGLVDRCNKQGRHQANHTIAMWKDDTGAIIEIPMPKGEGARGVLLSLWAEHVKDMTITGKLSEARAWRYSSHFPVCHTNAKTAAS